MRPETQTCVGADVSASSRKKDPQAPQDSEYAAARAAIIMMAAAEPACTHIAWAESVIVGDRSPSDIDVAARELAAVPKPVQCRAVYETAGLSVECSAITESKFAQAYAAQVELLERGEGVLGSLIVESADRLLSVLLIGAGEALQLSKEVLERIERDYLITMPLSLSKKRSDHDVEQGSNRWTVHVGYARPVSGREIEEWFKARLAEQSE